MLRSVLLLCGVLSSLVCVGTDVVAALRFGEYQSFATQTISELMSPGAPTKTLVDPLFMFCVALIIPFAAGVWMSARGNRALRISAALLIALAVAALPGLWLFPMQLRGSTAVAEAVPHAAVVSALLMIIVASIRFGAFALGRGFRVYSFATIVAIVVLAIVVAVEATALADGRPTPWIGLAERADVGLFLAWGTVLAFALLRVQRRGATAPAAAVASTS
jgi:hypothetical protein